MAKRQTQSPSVVVVGSSNTDLVVQSDKLPEPGMTVLGGEFQVIPGGKGANQAVALRAPVRRYRSWRTSAGMILEMRRPAAVRTRGRDPLHCPRPACTQRRGVDHGW